MKHLVKNILSLSIIALSAIAFAGSVSATSSTDSVKLLTANFEPRDVVQVEVGDFHFRPGQVAPIHTHVAPAVGYVVKGEIIYQVEGERQQILSAGDVFYEPVGPRILRFDNASATEEAIFVDFNLEQTDEPFIVFEQAPTEAIDRRSLPTIDLPDQVVNQVDFFVTELAKDGSADVRAADPVLGLVAEGVVQIQVNGKNKQRVVAGETFELSGGSSRGTFVNDSAEIPAKVITFRLR